jgi:hypothetical protein
MIPTMTDDAPRNIPVPDELADIRAKIKAYETREAELRQILFSDPSTRTGASWLAEIKITKQERTDLKELRACHPDIVAEFTYPVELTRIVLSGVTDDGEIVSARQMRSIAKAGDTAQ